ncbi:acyl-CoA thioesterase [Paenibacillus sp. D51F]
MKSEAEAWHLHPIRVRYKETDAMGIVFHTNYMVWFEIGRTELIRSAGYPYRRIEDEGLLLPVVDIDCSFHSPARYDDCLLICTRVESYTPMRMAFRTQIRRLPVEPGDPIPNGYPPIEADAAGAGLPGELLVSGGTRHVWVGKDFKPARLDRRLPELYAILKQHAGEPARKGANR